MVAKVNDRQILDPNHEDIVDARDCSHQRMGRIGFYKPRTGEDMCVDESSC